MGLSGLRVLTVWVVLAGLGCGAGQAEGRLRAAEGLRCEAVVTPLAVEFEHPQLSWRLEASSAGLRGVGQSAYRVLVASSRRMLGGGRGDMWDSGRVESGDSFGVAYRGKALGAETAYFWRVMVWDAQAVATNETAEMPLFRREFVVKKKLVRAVMDVSALGQGEVHLNGVKVGDAELAPGWTDYRKTVRYETYDVTGMLRAGRNAVGVMVGNGMFNVVKTPHRYTKLENSFGRPMVLLQMRLSYADGTSEVVATDASWSAAAGACLPGSRRPSPGVARRTASCRTRARST